MSTAAQDSNASPGRNAAEWVSLAIASLLVLAVLGIIVVMWVSSSGEEARFVITAGEVRQANSLYYLPVTVSNMGDQTAADVLLEGTVGSGEMAEISETTFTFVPGHSEQQATLVFTQEPADVQLRVASYQQP